ncbi:Neurotrypsin [Geodia barretti]|nr:Neurotrypsin [Geodia barretti]
MEYNLTDCETGTGTRQSSHDEDVGVKCNTIDENYRNGDIRLVGGPHNWEGRVEIFWNGTWGTISDVDWGMSEAQVVCKQLELPLEGSVPSPYGQGSGVIRITSVNCSGSENNVIRCSLSMGSSSNHQNDVGVKCGKGADYKHGDIRLVGGFYSWEGRVEIYLDGVWGTITANSADGEDGAHVVCRQLGYDTHYGFDRNYYEAHFGEGVGTIHPYRLGCSGTEYRLVHCYIVSRSWYHNKDWSVSCLNDVPEEGEVKLFDRRNNYNRGLLQVWLNGRWGVVSDTAWTIEDTNTVCRQLGRNGITSTDSDYSTDLPVVMSNVMCVGTESRLIDCPYTTGGSGSPVSLGCTYFAPCAHGDVRLTNGQSENEGRLEICNSFSVWGTVCNKHWTQAVSKVACHSFGYGYEEGSYHTYSTFNRIPATFAIAADYVRCSGSENSLRECTYFSHSFSECSHNDDIGIICPPANCEDRDIKLRGTAGSEKEGLVLVCINKKMGSYLPDQ